MKKNRHQKSRVTVPLNGNLNLQEVDLEALDRYTFEWGNIYSKQQSFATVHFTYC